MLHFVNKVFEMTTSTMNQLNHHKSCDSHLYCGQLSHERGPEGFNIFTQEINLDRFDCNVKVVLNRDNGLIQQTLPCIEYISSYNSPSLKRSLKSL